MALSQTDLDALDRAIASGELTVSVDGRSVTYRSITELQRARQHVREVLTAQGGGHARRRFAVSFATQRGG